MDRTEQTAQAVLGRLTYTDMTDVSGLFLPPARDAFGYERTPFSPAMARLSAELAADGYDIDIKPWQGAGWGDCTFIVEDKIVALDQGSDSRLATMESEWKLRRARSMIRGVNPLGDLVRAIRQLMVTDLGKAIVMTRALPDGKAVIAISFIGTTQKYFDWFSNFKFRPEDGMHYGFMALARGFDAQTPRVLLPRLAAALGEETLTLADVMIEAQKPDSRFSFWISGHSQGGAIAQTYTHLLMAHGVPAANIHGYTFAAPTVANDSTVGDPAGYPIYNIINTDDVVPRVGARMRLGVDLIYRPNDAFRRLHYRVDDEHWEAFERMHHITGKIQTTDEAVGWGVAFVRLMREMEEDGEMATLFAEFMPQVAVFKRVNLSSHDVSTFLEEKLVAQYRGLTGGEPDETLCALYEEDMRSILAEFGAKALARALMQATGAPHRMRADKHEEGFEAPYIAIARRGLGRCERGVWVMGALPQCQNARGEMLLPDMRQALALQGANVPLLPPGDGNNTQASLVNKDEEE